MRLAITLALALAGSCLAQQFRAPFTIGGGAQLAATQGLLSRVAHAPLPRPAPRLDVEWLSPTPALAGKVLLVRFWTVDCAYCVASAPALEDLERRYGARGLQVIGVHHPKSDAGRDNEYVKRRARELGMTFPIAQDRDWRTLNAWWPDQDRAFTSATLLVDRRGQIRFVHEGGELHASTDRKHRKCDRELRRLEEAVERILAE